MTTTTTRYHPVPRAGTSGADHLAYEVTEQLQVAGYASAHAAIIGWYRACRRADRRRAAQGYTPVSRPTCYLTRVRGHHDV